MAKMAEVFYGLLRAEGDGAAWERVLAWMADDRLEMRRAVGEQGSRPDMDAIVHQLQIQYGIQAHVIGAYSDAWRAACLTNPPSAKDLGADVWQIARAVHGLHLGNACTLSTRWIEGSAMWELDIGDAQVADADALA